MSTAGPLAPWNPGALELLMRNGRFAAAAAALRHYAGILRMHQVSGNVLCGWSAGRRVLRVNMDLSCAPGGVDGQHLFILHGSICVSVLGCIW